MENTANKKIINIEPVTRLEGEAKISIHLNDDGNVDNAYFQTVELRGFEKFCQGRPVEEMPRIVTRVCGVCPGPHHTASGKAVDAVYKVEIPPAARTSERDLVTTVRARSRLARARAQVVAWRRSLQLHLGQAVAVRQRIPPAHVLHRVLRTAARSRIRGRARARRCLPKRTAL